MVAALATELIEGVKLTKEQAWRLGREFAAMGFSMLEDLAYLSQTHIETAIKAADFPLVPALKIRAAFNEVVLPFHLDFSSLWLG